MPLFLTMSSSEGFGFFGKEKKWYEGDVPPQGITALIGSYQINMSNGEDQLETIDAGSSASNPTPAAVRRFTTRHPNRRVGARIQPWSGVNIRAFYVSRGIRMEIIPCVETRADGTQFRKYKYYLV